MMELSALLEPGIRLYSATTAEAPARTTAEDRARNVGLAPAAATTREAERRRPLHSRATSKDVHTTTVRRQRLINSIGVVTVSASCMSNTTGNDDCLIKPLLENLCRQTNCFSIM
jgi:hypothetical protein